MKIKVMPTTLVLNIFSWLVAILGIIDGGAAIIYGSKEMYVLLNGLLIIGASFLLAAVIRMLANMGQMLFDLKIEVIQIKYALGRNEVILERNGTILEKNGSGLEQINCDSKDISQNIYQIKTFFEQIEKHLNLKK